MDGWATLWDAICEETAAPGWTRPGLPLPVEGFEGNRVLGNGVNEGVLDVEYGTIYVVLLKIHGLGLLADLQERIFAPHQKARQRDLRHAVSHGT